MTPGQIAYRQYLESDHWRNLRVAAFRMWGRKCFKCPRTFGLEVHHLFYRARWEDSLPQDLRPCCSWCHRKEHGFAPQVIPNQDKRRIEKRRRKKRNWARLAVKHSAMLDRQIRKRRQPKPTGAPKKKKTPRWWPGMYEGKAPYETMKEIGTSVPKAPVMSKTPDCMNPKINRFH